MTRQVPWNKGKKLPSLSEAHKKKISIAHIGKKREDIKRLHLDGRYSSPETRHKMGSANRGKRLSIETRKKLSDSHKKIINWNWRGGDCRTQDKKIRQSIEYKLWREAVFQRDDWTCQICKNRGGELNADHIKSFSTHFELRFNIDNGRTLCIDCHKKTPNYGGKNIKNVLKKNFDNQTT